jgi:hypothetical protein
MAKQTKQKEVIIETPLVENNEGQLITEITKNDIENNPEIEGLGLQKGDIIEVDPNDVQTFNLINIDDELIPNSEALDSLETLKYYSTELLVSLEGIFIGGHAAQKRDQLIEFLQKLK